MGQELKDQIEVVARFAEESRERYIETREWTHQRDSSCMTIRVPVALLNRIRDLAKAAGVETA